MSEKALDPDIARALFSETLRSERLRTRILFVVFGTIVAIAMIALASFGHDWFERLSQGRFRPWMSLALIVPFLLYEGLVGFVVLDRFIPRGVQPPLIARYVNAAIETTAPTVLILFSMTGSPAAFGARPSLAYFLFIVAATLRLDFALPAFIGPIAAGPRHHLRDRLVSSDSDLSGAWR